MMVKALPFACLLAVALGAVPMDMRGPGDEECHASVVNTCDMSSTHCVQIKYYLAPWEYTDSTDDKAREKGVVCMCKRGYSPDPENEMGCRKCTEDEDCHEGDMNPPMCGHNSCDFYSQLCVPDVDSYLGYTCSCQEGFIENPYNPLKCTWEAYSVTHGHEVMTEKGEKILSGSYGDEQYDGEFVDATRDAHTESNTGGTVNTGAHQYVAGTDQEYVAGFEERANSESVSSVTEGNVAMLAVGGGVALVALAAMAAALSRESATTTEAAQLTPSETSV